MASVTTTLSIPTMGTAVAPRRRSLAVASAAAASVEGRQGQEPSDGDIVRSGSDGRRGVILAAAGAAVTAVAAGSCRPARADVGAWKQVDVGDSRVQEIGRWAVMEHNKQKRDNLQFSGVLSAEEQVVAGLNYSLTVEATEGGDSSNYLAVVYAPPSGKALQLTKFERLLLS